MTTADVSAILAALSQLTLRVDASIERLARIEERTTVINDHETRLREMDEVSRMAGITATHAKTLAESLDVRVAQLENRGKWTLPVLAKAMIALTGFALTILMIVQSIRGW